MNRISYQTYRRFLILGRKSLGVFLPALFAIVLTVVAGAPVGARTSARASATPPAIASGTEANFTTGYYGTFTVTSKARPNASLSESGSLPDGVSFIDNGNGTATLSGYPADGSAGTYPIVITASNGVPPDATQNFTLTVVAPLHVTTGYTLPPATVGTRYSTTLQASGGNPPYRWRVIGGGMPIGLRLQPRTGVISGTPKSSGTAYPEVQVVDHKVNAKPRTRNNEVLTFEITVSPGQ